MKASKGKVIAACVALLGLVYLGVFMSYAVTAKIEHLVLCAEGKDRFFPAAWCYEAILKLRGDAEDVQALNSTIGIGWALAVEPTRRRTFAEFLIDRGVQVNGVDPYSGLTALHSAALEGDVFNVRLLLALGADPSVRDSKYGMTPQELLSQKSKSALTREQVAALSVLQEAEKPR